MRSFLLFALFAIGSGVVTAQTESADDTRLEIVPLDVGNSWTYTVVAPVDRTEMRESQVVVTVSESSVVAGQRYFRFDGLGEMRPLLFATGDSGLYAWDDDAAIRQLMLRYPARAGDSYVIGGERESKRVVVDIVAIDAAVDVDGETHAAYQYRIASPDGDRTVELFVVPGVGVVKLSALNVGRRRTEEMTAHLVRYTLAKPHKSEPASDVR